MESDPWGESKCSEKREETADKEDSSFFTDNFTDKLPDHQEYLEKLEKKLEKLNSKSSIVGELAKRRSDDAKRMLESNAAEIEHYFEECGENSAIARRLFPEKQALNMSEVAKLLESDSLAKTYSEDKKSQEEEQLGDAQ